MDQVLTMADTNAIADTGERSAEATTGAADHAPVVDLLPPEQLAKAVAGEPYAVALLLAKVQPQVERFCRARLGRRETTLGSADDVAQDICMAVLSVLPDYRLSGMSFRAFVFGIARHKIADAFRAMSRNRCDAVEELPERVSRDDDPEQAFLDAERSERLSDLLNVLGPRQVEILTLRVAVGLSAEETADALDSTPGAVRVAQHRALQRLRRELDARAARRAATDGTTPVVPAARRAPAASPGRTPAASPGRTPAASPGRTPAPDPASPPAVPAPRLPQEAPSALPVAV